MFMDWLNLFLDFFVRFFNFLNNLVIIPNVSYLGFLFAVIALIIIIDNFLPKG